MIKSFEELSTVLGSSAPAWEALVGYIRVHYAIDEAWDGNNDLKFRRGGKTFVTLYVHEGYFTLLLIYGKAERARFEQQRTELNPILRALYEKSKTYHDGKWMFLDIRDAELLPDIRRMLLIKKRPNRKKQENGAPSKTFL